MSVSEMLVNPPVAFVLYIVLSALIYLFGRRLAGPGIETDMKTSTYSSGEAPPLRTAAPGYRPFFVVALFFAVLHLGALVLGSGGFSTISGIYLVGLFVALLVLVLG
jgi:NADH:ubiquinone oxidoreductase subunit 3 (subunit A)